MGQNAKIDTKELKRKFSQIMGTPVTPRKSTNLSPQGSLESPSHGASDDRVEESEEESPSKRLSKRMTLVGGQAATQVSLKKPPFVHYKDYLPTERQVYYHIEPVLKEPLSLFSGQIQWGVQDLEPIIQTELYKYRKAEVMSLNEKCDALEAENSANAILLTEL